LREETPRCLVGAAEEGVRRATEPQPAPLGLGQEPPAVGYGGGKRLFGVDVLAGLERCAHERRVHRGRRQIEDEVDVRVREQVVHRLRA
jgi:hypothetical protein